MPDGGPVRYSHGVYLTVGSVVDHSTFGRGRVTATRGSGDSSQAEVEFDPPIGPKWLLLRYAPLCVVHLQEPIL